MKLTQRQWVGAIVVGVLLLALPAGAPGLHTHTDGTSKTCTLCPSLHLPGALTPVSDLPKPAACDGELFTAEAVFHPPLFALARGIRGPPSPSSNS